MRGGELLIAQPLDLVYSREASKSLADFETMPAAPGRLPGLASQPTINRQG
ncbi:MAG: hypothetical protein AB7L90_05005 [Hyphomicrobiaceae bacterium]